MKHFYMLFAAVLVSSALQAQVPVYSTGFDNATQQDGWQQYRQGAADPFYDWNFQSSQAYSAPTCLMHNYPVGGSAATDDWFVSPSFAIPTGGMLDSLRYAFSGFGLPAAGDTVFLYLLNGSPDPDLATKTILYEFSGPDYQNDNTWRLLEPVMLPAQSGNSYFAFRYRTVNNWLDVRFDNLAISRNSAAGLNEQEAGTVRLFPNPAAESLQLQAGSAWTANGMMELEICDAAGKRVLQQQVTNEQAVSLSLAAGCYTYRISASGMVPVAGKLVVR
jgi:hypothetical protein